MKKLAALILLLAAIGVRGADQVEVFITVTNTPTTGSNIVFNGATRTWTNAHSASTILTNLVALGVNNSATNLYNNLALFPLAAPRPVVQQIDTNKLRLIFAIGYPGVVTASAGWASVTNYTNTVTPMLPVRVPASAEPSASNRVHIASRLVEYFEHATNSFFKHWTAFNQFPSLTNNNAFTGTNSFANGGWDGGSFTNALAISGILSRLTNGYSTNLVLDSPIATNLTVYGGFTSAGSGNGSISIGDTADPSGIDSMAIGNLSAASGQYDVAVGNASTAGGGSSVAVGFGAGTAETNAVAIGTSALVSAPGGIAIGSFVDVAAGHTNSIGIGADTSETNQVMIGASTHKVRIPGQLQVTGTITNSTITGANNWQGDIAFVRTNNTGLANGNNAGIVINDRTYIKVSGPSAAFTINGIAGGRDGRRILIQNSTTFTMTIANDSGTDPTAANRIYTGTGADVTSTNTPGFVELMYDSATSRWGIISKSN